SALRLPLARRRGHQHALDRFPRTRRPLCTPTRHRVRRSRTSLAPSETLGNSKGAWITYRYLGPLRQPLMDAGGKGYRLRTQAMEPGIGGRDVAVEGAKVQAESPHDGHSVLWPSRLEDGACGTDRKV